MYARCLRELGRTEDYVRIALKALARSVRPHIFRSDGFPAAAEPHGDGLNSGQLDIGHVLQASKALKEPVVVPLRSYFSHIQIEPHITHLEDMDGFALSITFQNLLTEAFVIHQAQVRLVSSSEGQSREISLVAEDSTAMKTGLVKLPLISKVRS